MNWKQRFYQFMQGRYGMDQLGKYSLGAALVCFVISAVTVRVYNVSTLFQFAGLLLLIWTYVRMFSRNIGKRAAENQKFLAKTAGLRRQIGRERYLMQERKTSHIYTCPGCGQKIRAPKGKGKIEIRCPKCSTTFIKRS